MRTLNLVVSRRLQHNKNTLLTLWYLICNGISIMECYQYIWKMSWLDIILDEYIKRWKSKLKVKTTSDAEREWTHRPFSKKEVKILLNYLERQGTKVRWFNILFLKNLLVYNFGRCTKRALPFRVLIQLSLHLFLRRKVPEKWDFRPIS